MRKSRRTKPPGLQFVPHSSGWAIQAPPSKADMGRHDFYGRLDIEEGSPGFVFHIPRGAVSKWATANELRQIIDKLDKLNGVKKKRRRSLGRSYCYIASTLKGVNAAFGRFTRREKAEEVLRRKGWRRMDDGVWTNSTKNNFARVEFIIHPELRSIRELPLGS